MNTRPAVLMPISPRASTRGRREENTVAAQPRRKMKNTSSSGNSGVAEERISRRLRPTWYDCAALAVHCWKNMPSAQSAVQKRYARRFRRAPSEKNSNRASNATEPPAAATSHVGPHHTNAATAGIKIAAVKMRVIVPELAHEFTLVQCCLLGSSFRLQCRNFGTLRSQTTIAPFALLIVCQRRIEFRAPKIGPQRLGDVDLRIRDLPQQEIADAQLAAGADEQVGIGQA